MAYAPPASRYISIVKNGKLLFRFDPSRGIIEINARGETTTVDLAAEVERLQSVPEAGGRAEGGACTVRSQ